jgi:hypothetical protein
LTVTGVPLRRAGHAQVGIFVAVEAGVDAVRRHHGVRMADASIRLPTVISALLTRPLIGACTWVYDRFSLAAS